MLSNHDYLHKAAMNKNGLNAVKAYIKEHGIPVDTLHSIGTRAVEWAAQDGSLETVKYLVEEAHANLDASNSERNLLHWALENDSPEVLLYVADPNNPCLKQFNDGTTDLHAAAAIGDIAAVKKILTNNPERSFEANNKGQTALYWAALAGKPSVVQLILTHPSLIGNLSPEKLDPFLRGSADRNFLVFCGLEEDETAEKKGILQEIIQCTNMLIQKTPKDYGALAKYHRELGKLFRFTQPELAQENYQLAISMIDKIEKTSADYGFIARCIHAIAIVYAEKNQTEKAFESEQKAIFYCEKMDDGQQKESLFEILHKHLEQFEHELKLVFEAKKWGFECKDVENDGACFFHAVADQLNQLKDFPYQNLNERKLRQILITHIRNNVDFYRDFVPNNDSDAYIIEMNQKNTWADHVAISALARELNVTIAIIDNDANHKPNVIKMANPIATIYLGYEVDLHFQSLIRRADWTPINSIEQIIAQTAIDEYQAFVVSAIPEGFKFEDETDNNSNPTKKRRLSQDEQIQNQLKMFPPVQVTSQISENGGLNLQFSPSQ